MPSSSRMARALSIGRRPAPLQWAILLALSVAGVAGLEALHLPAALLLGPMAAAILVAAADGTIRMPSLPFMAAQTVIGCMIARSLTPATLGEILQDWPLFLVAVVSVILASNGLGWLLTRARVLPGTTAVWGSFPGAASVMTLMSEEFGADGRLVAIMQYLRVVFVAVAASLVARLWGAPDPAAVAAAAWFPPIDWPAFAATLALAAGAGAIAVALRVPAGPLLLPMAVGTALQGTGVLAIELPPWLLATSYAVVGWSIGLRFSRPIIAHAARALPRIATAILTLIALCGGLAALLVVVGGVDPLTAYLATSPGGADSVAIIAAGSDVDLPFVVALQTTRFLVVLVTGPAIARYIARRAGAAAPVPHPGE
ncbi:AbrB family transcriptional regulator [Azospirillum sp. ST 5-10]|uniref:AbrB family transcriptional regulator n=1 Tax=unclassified Azospirillum TaxID=2630922 RepID=UPI003F49C9D0